MTLVVETRSVQRKGETANGDAAFVRSEGATTIFAVIDGLGHGPAAAKAAQLATEGLGHWEIGADLGVIMADIDQRLAETRGAGAMVCRLTEALLEGCTVGNIRLTARGVDVPVVLSPGILGRRVRRFRIFGGRLQRPCRLLLHSDGISARANLSEVANAPLPRACDILMERHRISTDDSTLLLADYRPSS